jgi:hypothetical protein
VVGLEALYDTPEITQEELHLTMSRVELALIEGEISWFVGLLILIL